MGAAADGSPRAGPAGRGSTRASRRTARRCPAARPKEDTVEARRGPAPRHRFCGAGFPANWGTSVCPPSPFRTGFSVRPASCIRRRVPSRRALGLPSAVSSLSPWVLPCRPWVAVRSRRASPARWSRAPVIPLTGRRGASFAWPRAWWRRRRRKGRPPSPRHRLPRPARATWRRPSSAASTSTRTPSATRCDARSCSPWRTRRRSTPSWWT